MATTKPRFSVTFSDDAFAKIQKYQKDNSISTQSKAVAQLVELAMSEVESGQETIDVSNSDMLESDTLRSTLLHNFDQLNHEGRERLVETSDDMVASGKYIKSDPAELGQKQNA